MTTISKPGVNLIIESEPEGISRPVGAQRVIASPVQSGFLRVAGIIRVGTVAYVTTVGPHGYADQSTVTISGADQSAYNVTALATVTGLNSFTYPVAGSPSSPATGNLILSAFVSGPPVSKGVTMSPPSDYYTTSSGFTIDDGIQEMRWVPFASQGQLSTVPLNGAWYSGFTPSNVEVTLRSPSNWVAGPASTPAIGFYLTGKFIDQQTSDFTEQFTAADQEISQTLTWTGGAADTLGLVHDGVGIGYHIVNIVFSPEPS